MKSKIYAGIGRLFLITLLIQFIPVYNTAQEFRSVQDGIEYAEITREVDNQPVKMNLLRLDLTKVRLDVVHAMDAAIGTETTSSIAARHGAIAAINAGFFRLDRSIFAGDGTGILQIDGKLLSESYADRTALLIDNSQIPCSKCSVPEDKTIVSFEHLQTWNLALIGKHSFSALGINRQRKENDLVLFTPQFGATTLTNPDGVEIVIKKGKVAEIIKGKGSNKIPSDGFVLSASGSRAEDIFQKVKIKQKFDFRFSNDVRTPDGKNVIKYISRFEDIVGGVPQLIKNGKIEITWEQEKSSKAFVETRHPRTAVAKLKDGKFLMMTVDGRQAESAGINLQRLAEILLELDATDAMNLDGGGSTTMFLNGKVVNRPSDKEGERKVSDAILVFPRKK